MNNSQIIEEVTKDSAISLILLHHKGNVIRDHESLMTAKYHALVSLNFASEISRVLMNENSVSFLDKIRDQITKVELKDCIKENERFKE